MYTIIWFKYVVLQGQGGQKYVAQGCGKGMLIRILSLQKDVEQKGQPNQLSLGFCVQCRRVVYLGGSCGLFAMLFQFLGFSWFFVGALLGFFCRLSFGCYFGF
jgi:hypothetical protein